ncbi:MAG TPA: glycosyltransferase family 2 protein [Pseudolabrys sp.]|nr:glycosyltransferase family 2 protein [Pseudolabrys sp.]
MLILPVNSEDIRVPPVRCSVVIPSYNRLNVLPRAVDSVLTQDERDIELIIVDDSTDATRAWLTTLTDPRVKVILPPQRRGVSAARNLGIAAARAPVIAFLDSDDWYLPGRLARAIETLERDGGLVCTLSSARKEVRGKMRPSPLPDVKLAPPVFEWALYSDLIGVDGSSITVRTEAARATGFCEAMSRTEDREFLIRLAPRGAVRLLADVTWEKGWSIDSLSNEWKGAGRDLLKYVTQRPELATRFRKIGSYLASKILVSDLRRGDFTTLASDWTAFRRAGLLRGGIARIWRDHREVRHYRRTMSNRDALAQLAGAPAEWA